jgi:hypothetical protein
MQTGTGSIHLFINPIKIMNRIKHSITLVILIAGMLPGTIFRPEARATGFVEPVTSQTLTTGFYACYSPAQFSAWIEPADPFYDFFENPERESTGPGLGTCVADRCAGLWNYIHSEAFRSRLPEDLGFAWNWDTPGGNGQLFALRKPDREVAPGREDVRGVVLQKDEDRGNYDLIITFTDAGAVKWARMTRENVGKSIAIVVDGKVVAAPRVMMEIKQGKCRISGDFDKEEAGHIKELLEQ